MSDKPGLFTSILGCLLAPILAFGGPALTFWICIHYFGWPTWVSVIVGIGAGGQAGVLLVFTVLMPLLAVDRIVDRTRARKKQNDER